MTGVTGSPRPEPEYRSETPPKKEKKGNLPLDQTDKPITKLPKPHASQLTHQEKVAKQSIEIAQTPMKEGGEALSPKMHHKGEPLATQHNISPKSVGHANIIDSTAEEIIHPEPPPSKKEGISPEQEKTWNDLFSGLGDDKEEVGTIDQELSDAWNDLYSEHDDDAKQNDFSQAPLLNTKTDPKVNKETNELDIKATGLIETRVADKQELSSILAPKNVINFQFINMTIEGNFEETKNPTSAQIKDIMETGFIHNKKDDTFIYIQQKNTPEKQKVLATYCSTNGIDISKIKCIAIKESDIGLFFNILTIRLAEIKSNRDAENKKDEQKDNFIREAKQIQTPKEIKYKKGTEDDKNTGNENKIIDDNEFNEELSKETSQKYRTNKEQEKEKERIYEDKKETFDHKEISKKEIKEGEKRKENAKNDIPLS